MHTIRIRLKSDVFTLTTEGQLFQKLKIDGKPRSNPITNTLRLDVVNPSDAFKLPPGEYYYLFNAMNGFGKFSIVIEQRTEDEFVEIDSKDFTPESPEDTFNIPSSFILVPL